MKDGALQAVFRHVVTHPVAVCMIFIAAAVFGWVGYQQLPVELMPDVSYPTLTVRTEYAGAAPEEVERQVSQPVEEALATLDGLVTLESRSRAGRSDVLLGFDWGTDMPGAVQSVREKLQVLFLPQGTERPLILRYDPSLEPFLRLGLARGPEAAPLPDEEALLQLRELAEGEIKRELEGLEGVAAVRVRGGLEREIRVEVRSDWLAARRVRLEQVQAALAAENVNIAGGSILEGDVEYLVRTLNEYRDVEELRQVRVPRDDGVRVPLTELAVVTEAWREREVVTRLGGSEAVEIELFKEADANVVAVARRVKQRLLRDPGATRGEATDEDLARQTRRGERLTIEERLPRGVIVEVLEDQARFIEQAVTNLRNTALLGGLFAIGMLFLFLRDFRSTAIIGVAIPVSVVMAFGPLYTQGVSLNLMSLGGLALGVGMLVDNAVVVLENVQRYREEGLGRVDAAVQGASTVAGAVTASTLTTVAVFLPIAFVEGIAGELFGDLAVAVIASLMASLAVALFLVPTLAALALLPAGASAELPGVLGVLARRRTWRQARREAAIRAATDGVARPLRPMAAIWAAWGLRSWFDAGAWREAWLGWRAVASAVGQALWGRPVEVFREHLAWVRARKRRVPLVPYLLARLGVQVGLRLVAVPPLLLLAVGVAMALGVLDLVVRPAAGVLLAGAGAFQRAYLASAAGYRGMLRGALARPGLVLGLSVLLLVVAVAAGRQLGSELIPEVHQGRFTVEAALPVGTPLLQTAAVTRELEERLLAHPEVATVHTTVGVDRRADARADEGEHTARLRVTLTGSPGRGAAAREARVMEELRHRLADVPRVEVAMVRPSLFAFRTPVEVVIHGWDLRDLRQAGDQVAHTLSGVEGLRDVRTSLVPGYPEVQVHYDRDRLHRLGLDPGTVAQRVRDQLQGVRATALRRGDLRVDLRVQLAEHDRQSLSDLRRLNVNPQVLPPIPLDAVATLVEGEGPSEVRRVDQQRAVVVSAGLQGFDLGTAGARIEAALAGQTLPGDASFVVAGQSREMERSLGSLQFALLLAIFLVYVIMAATFESLVHPFVILFSVPLAIIGVVGGLAVAGVPISVVVFIGAIVLAGVVVNNAIVLVDTINRLRAEGLTRLDAIRRGGALRLRPILITSATTILGLLPLSLGLGSGAEVQRPLAVTVIGGLLSATLLTLVVIPVVYALVTSRWVGLSTAEAPEQTPEAAG